VQTTIIVTGSSGLSSFMVAKPILPKWEKIKSMLFFKLSGHLWTGVRLNAKAGI
jgi:hypothetical protein